MAAVVALVFVPTVVAGIPGNPAAIAVGSVFFIVVLFVSVLAHELTHAFVARARGHYVYWTVITGLRGMIRYDSTEITPRSFVLIAAAGPATNVVFALACWYASHTAGAITSSTPTVTAMAVLLLSVGTIINTFLALFNLFPSLAMDGGAILEGLIWRVSGDRAKGKVVAARVGRIFAVVMVASALGLYLLGDSRVSSATLVLAVLLGWYLFNGATSALAAQQSQRPIDWLDLGALMRPAVGVNEFVTIADVAATMERARVGYVVVTDIGDTAIGYIDAAVVASVPLSEQAGTGCPAVLTQLRAAPAVSRDAVGHDVIAQVAVGLEFSSILVVRAAPILGYSRGVGAPVGLLWESDVLARFNAT